MKKPINENYAAVVVEIKILIPLEGCDNIQAAIIMGQQIIVSKEVKIGDIGLYFPVECALSKQYLSANNLYRKKLNLNVDLENKGGYFEIKGRIRCAKFLGHKSEGLFMPLESLIFVGNTYSLSLNDCFDELNGTPICSKYVVQQQVRRSLSGTKNQGKNNKKITSKLIENQFRFHQDTCQLYRNIHRIKPDDLISITYKLHGTSGISSNVLCKKPLKRYEKVLKWLGVNVVDSEYDYIYASRKVIKNEALNPDAIHYYNEDIWGIAHNEIKDFLQKGMTFYYEIVGFLPSGGYIQSPFDYGCKSYSHSGCEHKVYIYRITSTNVNGKVIEFSAKQVQDFCKSKGLNPVPELYYGKASNLAGDYWDRYSNPDETFQDWFLNEVKAKYNEHDCYMCVNELPEEGAVIRIEGNELEVFKCKSNRFYELETKMLDKGEVDIENLEE